MKKWMKITLLVLASLIVGTLEFGAGYHFGQKQSPAKQESRVADFNAGKASFCDLDEDDRFAVCPVIRKQTVEAAGKGRVTLYICDSTRRNGYVTISKNATAQFRTQLMAYLAGMAANGAKVEKSCETKTSEIYKVSPQE